MSHPARLAALVALALVALPLASADAAFKARGSTHEAYVLGAERGERLQLMQAGDVVRTARADRLGAKIWRELKPGRYTVRRAGGRTKRLTVLRRGQNPKQAFYRRKRLKQGLNYVTTRDGVELAMTVRLPRGKTLADGPFPTVVELSGYQTAAPNDLFDSVVAQLSGRQTARDPLVPATGTAVGALIAPLLDFAVVSVQMRGSGCSGGAFDLFGLPTTYDGYDTVETVAAQPWAKGGKVGMVGISFSGITQLFTAGTRPPHLAAISPMSVSDDGYRASAYPGGIRNSGFTSAWLRDRMDDAEPAPRGGQPWARELARRGDRHCIANQRLRLQTQDIVARTRRTPYRTALSDLRSAASWMRRIKAPVFFVGQFQDEQTGGHFAQSLDRLSANRRVWITMQNGVHADSLGPDSLTRWVEFLNLYVADRTPRVSDSVLSLSDQMYRFLADAPASRVQQSRFAQTTDVSAARAAFERDQRVRLLMDNGAGPKGPGSIGSVWELGFDAWPISEVEPEAWSLGAAGRLERTPAAGRAVVGYTADPASRPAQTLPGDGEADAWKAQPPYDWRPVPAGKGVGFATPPLERDVVIAGPSSLDLELASSARDTDLQATISEIRPDGRETYVQSGWLRASHRRLSARSTATNAIPTHRRRDARRMPRNRFVKLRVPIFPVAHAFRAGSRIRVTLTAPGGERPRWRFATVDRGRTRNRIVVGDAGASRLMLPVVRGATAKGTPLPGPTALRGQPSRTYALASNGG